MATQGDMRPWGEGGAWERGRGRRSGWRTDRGRRGSAARSTVLVLVVLAAVGKYQQRPTAAGI